MIVAWIIFFECNYGWLGARMRRKCCQVRKQSFYIFLIVFEDDWFIGRAAIFFSGKLDNPGDKWRWGYLAGQLSYYFFAGLSGEIEQDCINVGCSLDEVEMHWIFEI